MQIVSFLAERRGTGAGPFRVLFPPKKGFGHEK